MCNPAATTTTELFRVDWEPKSSNFNPKLENLSSFYSITVLKFFMILLYCEPPGNFLETLQIKSGYKVNKIR